MNIDVIMLTHNSAKPFFEKCLMALKENVPINQLIVVDGNSNDNTVEIIQNVFSNPKIIFSNHSLAQARKLGISYLETPWFAFIDSDVMVAKDWFKKLSKVITQKTGGIQGTDQYANRSLIRYDKWKKNVWRKKITHESFEPFSIITQDSFKKNRFRGLTHNTLIQTSCVRDWDPPTHLNVGEDHHLFLHVISKGYTWIVKNDVVCLHYAFLDLGENIRRGLKESQEVKNVLKHRYISKEKMWIDASATNYLKMFSVSCIKGLLASICENDPQIFLFKISFYGSMLLSSFVDVSKVFRNVT